MNRFENAGTTHRASHYEFGVVRRVCFSFAGFSFQIDCGDVITESLVTKNFGFGPAGCTPDAQYAVRKTAEYFEIILPSGATYTTTTDAQFLYIIEKEVTVEAQLQRQNLYFVHSGVLEFQGNGVLLIGESGAGKSTLTWALLHHGFRYLSDELAPIDLEALKVYPYPHAICLKKAPPEPYGLPEGALHTSRTIHIPVSHLPSAVCTDAQPVRFLFFVTHDPSVAEPSIVSISQSEGAARLYSSTLNSLAHRGLGLGQAISIARACRCFTLTSASAERTCIAVKSVVSP